MLKIQYLDPYLILYTKVKNEIVKLLEGNKGEHFHGIGIQKAFLTQKKQKP